MKQSNQQVVSIRFSKEEYQMLQDLIKRTGLQKSEVVRLLVRSATVAPMPVVDAAKFKAS